MKLRLHLARQHRKKKTVGAMDLVWIVFTILTTAEQAAAQDNEGVSANAPEVSFYAGITEECCGEDPHPVHGIETPDGGYLIVGKNADGGGSQDGFVVRIPPGDYTGVFFLSPDEVYSYQWAQTFGQPGAMDGANFVAATESAAFVSGFKAGADGSLDAHLSKYLIADGTLVWEMQIPDSQAETEGAFEAIQLTSDGGLIAAGVTSGSIGSTEGFKSYGNPTDGQAFVAYFGAEQIAGDTAPATPSWSLVFPDALTVKGIREVPDETGGYVMVTSTLDEGTLVYRLDPEGQTLWTLEPEEHGEPTDIAVLTDAGVVEGFAISGHGGDPVGIDGCITKVSPEGAAIWTQRYGNPVGGIGRYAGLDAGNPKLVFDECWGIQAGPDGGALMACGTGIEGCDEWDEGSDIRAECEADPRRTWRGLLIGIDREGNQIWHRTDSFVEPGTLDDEVSDAASEYVSLGREGRVISIVDHGFGIGLLVLAPPDTPSPPATGDTGTGNPDAGGTRDVDPMADGGQPPYLRDNSTGNGGCACQAQNDSNRGLASLLILMAFGLVFLRGAKRVEPNAGSQI